jgi:predicted phosphodiesterase
MKILVIADDESKALWDYYTPDKTEGVELIVSCGDLSADYLEFLVTMTNCPLLYVPGNHDTAYLKKEPSGCINIDGGVYVYKGLRFFGLGGSMKYKKGPYMYTEWQMRHRILGAANRIIRQGGVDIFVGHAPVKDFGDLPDLPHRGYACFEKFLNVCRPRYFLHGHVHASYMSRFKRENLHPSGTIVVNGYDKYILEVSENKRSAVGRPGLIKGLFTGFW